MKKVYISENAGMPLIFWLESMGYSIDYVRSTDLVYNSVSSHPDIYMCKMGVSADSPLIKSGLTDLGFSYPGNIKYNAVCLDRYFVHNVKYTARGVLSAADALGLERISVKQGYTKCNTVVVDGRSVITSDDGIYDILAGFSDIDVLKIRPGYVRLSGFEYGFLGGASGRVGDVVVFNGDLSTHPDFDIIKKFIEDRGLQIKYFTEYPLEDIGTIIESVY